MWKYVLLFAISCHIIFNILCEDTDSSQELNTTTTVSTTTSRGPDLTLLKFDASVRCKVQLNAHRCSDRPLSSSYYYDLLLQDCTTGPSGDCKDNTLNNFKSLSLCKSECRGIGNHDIEDYNMSRSMFCRLQPDFGSCDNYHPMFYYDISNRECRGFSWSGCGGNLNKFFSIQMCALTCGKVINYN